LDQSPRRFEARLADIRDLQLGNHARLRNCEPVCEIHEAPRAEQRNTRILTRAGSALFEALPKLWRKRQRTEMYRRLVAAIDLGLREGEMLKVQMKLIDFTSWAITLPPESAKGGATTDHAETVYAMTPCPSDA
jgi:hypothetical protein